MIISQTPMRMSFFGGGTDFPEFFGVHGGAVISTTFDKYCHVNVRPLPELFDYKTYLAYAQIEKVNSVDEIRHPAIRNAMKWLGLERICLNYDADLPSKTGLGTSGLFAMKTAEFRIRLPRLSEASTESIFPKTATRLSR